MTTPASRPPFSQPPSSTQPATSQSAHTPWRQGAGWKGKNTYRTPGAEGSNAGPSPAQPQAGKVVSIDRQTTGRTLMKVKLVSGEERQVLADGNNTRIAADVVEGDDVRLSMLGPSVMEWGKLGPCKANQTAVHMLCILFLVLCSHVCIADICV